MQAADRLTPEQLAAGLAAREARAAEREAGRAAMREQFEREAQRNAARFFDEHGSPIDFPTILEGLVRAIDTRFGKLEIQKHAVDELKSSVEENTELTKKLAEDTAEIVAVAKALSGAVKVIEMGGKLAKPLAWIFAVLFGLAVFLAPFFSVKTGVTLTPPK